MDDMNSTVDIEMTQRPEKIAYTMVKSEEFLEAQLAGVIRLGIDRR